MSSDTRVSPRKDCSPAWHRAACHAVLYEVLTNLNVTPASAGNRAHRSSRIAEHFIPGGAQRDVGVVHRRGNAKRRQARNAMLTHAARHNPGEVGQVGIDVQRDTVPGHPATDTDPDGTDFGLGTVRYDPDADTALPPFALDVEAA